ncbi:MAG: hypothetical protein K5906_01055, partial [Bacilli bacterium]|nr:hypothetical protein [Bacilli bacterium]
NNNNKSNDIKKYIATFSSGFIIALFLVLFILLMVMNKVRGMNNDTTSITPPSTSSSEIEVTSSIDDSSAPLSISSEIDYSKEISIYNNLKSVINDFDDTLDIKKIININYDSTDIYIDVLTNDGYLYHMMGSLLTSTVDEVLETLITSSSSFSIDSVEALYSLGSTPTIDITSLEAFNHKDYTYINKTNYYLNALEDEVGLTSIGKKDNKYISIINMKYLISGDTLITSGVGTYIKEVDDSSSQYYKFIAYLYTL